MEKSRAIELLEHLVWDRDIDRNPYGDALNMAIDALKAQLSSEYATSDTISRQAALDIFDDYNISVENGELEAYSRDRKRLCELPAAQPVATDTNVGDTISRQAAIDAIEDYPHGNVWNVESMEEMVDKIKALTSVQPETAKRIVGKVRDGMTLWYQCDMCNEPVDEQDNYCRGCGRRLVDG